jgi:GMP reductase
MRIFDGLKLSFDDVMIVPSRSEINSRADVELKRVFRTKHSFLEFECFPIIASNLSVLGVFPIASKLSELSCFTALHKFHNADDHINFSNQNNNFYNFYTIGIKDADLEKFEYIQRVLNTAGRCYSFLMIDAPNGYISKFADFCKKARDKYPGMVIAAGNVATPDLVEHLINDCGVDIVKCSIGTGGLCETTEVTGVGYPNFSVYAECSNAAHGVGGLIIADGGHKTIGDIAKSFAAGSDFVMLGSMLAGASECEGEWDNRTDTYYITHGFDNFNRNVYPTKRKLKIYGMSSDTALNKFYGGVENHRTSEGKTKYVDDKGPVANIIQQIQGGLRSTCTYIGASRLKDLSKRATFIRVNK